ncbi:hypothetical protein SAMN05444162_1581 [Paenibacillaceae bacterium GAS479]|nr:hypothetical protein SAMN05444162_1581 [Paenibacillaceae bacterium GAS479]
MKKSWKTTAASLLVLSMTASGGTAAFAMEGQPAPAPGQVAITAAPSDASSLQKINKDFIKLLASGKLAQSIAYLNNNLSKVDKWTASMMVLRLENAQNAALKKLSLRFDEKMQKSIGNAWKKAGFGGVPLDDLWSKGGSGTYTSLLKNVKDEATRKILTDARDQGYVLDTQEGWFSPLPNYPMYEKWKSYVSSDIKSYIDIMSLETRIPVWRDNSVVISWADLLQRNLGQEKFLLSYKSSNRYNQVKAHYDRSRQGVFYGDNNTMLFDYETNKIQPDALEAYKKAIAAGDTKSSPLLMKLSNFLKVVERNDGKLTDEVLQWRKKQVSNG